MANDIRSREVFLPCGTQKNTSGAVLVSAESIRTLKNRESIHFGYFCDRLREKNRFMIHEPIHVSIHVSFLL